jgi:hypothetical protein
MVSRVRQLIPCARCSRGNGKQQIGITFILYSTTVAFSPNSLKIASVASTLKPGLANEFLVYLVSLLGASFTIKCVKRSRLYSRLQNSTADLV